MEGGPTPEPSDDPTVPDEAELWRRIPPWHFVVDENLDRTLLKALERRDAAGLRAIPRTQLYSAASEALNWVALGGAMQKSDLKMELLDYVPVYRTPAGTGGGWAFARWR